jgi:GAF domain-containing protein
MPVPLPVPRSVALANAAPDSSDPLRSVTFVLQETVGIPFDAPAAPARVVGDGAGAGAGDAPWDLGLLRGAHNDIVLFDSVQQHLLAGLAPRGHAEAHPRAAAALPIVQGEELVGCLVVYISGARPVTPALRTFLVLLAREMSTSASVVAAYEDEMQSVCLRARALGGC